MLVFGLLVFTALLFVLLVIFSGVFSISDIALNMIGGLIGVFMSNSLIEKINLRFC